MLVLSFPAPRFVVTILLSFLAIASSAQTTSWRGTTSTAWATAGNWTNGVPTAGVDAVIGDDDFTGTFEPSITAAATTRSLTVGGGVRTITLTVGQLLTVSGDLAILNNGTITHTSNSISLVGNWTNTGTYSATADPATVVFSGTEQTINSPTSFRRVTINPGSTTTLAASITVSNAFAVSGIFDPATGSNLVTLTGSSFTVNAASSIRVLAATFSGNYSEEPALNGTSVVEYASASIDQTVAPFNYGTLTITGGTVKSLEANTVLQSSSSGAGRVNVNGGTLDLGTFTLNRNAGGGGGFTVSNGAQLIIGGTNTFPANYSTTTLGPTSTVVYGGGDQTIASKAYGNLLLRGTTGNVAKTLPATTTTISGNLTSSIGTATSVSFTANGALVITGNVSIGASTTFNGGTATHVVSGDWTNAGTFTGNTSTIRFDGPSSIIGGSGVQNFNNLTLAGNGVTSSGNITLNGNLATLGSTTFAHNAGTLTMSGAAKTISGDGISLSNLVISGSISTATSFSVSGTLTTTGSLNATGGTVTFNGSPSTIAGSGTTTFFAVNVSGAVSTAANVSFRSDLSGAGKLTATGGTASFVGNSTVTGTHDLFNLTLNGTRLQLGANATLGVAGAFILTSGTFSTSATTPNTFVYNGSGSQNVTAANYNNLTFANAGTKTATGSTTSGGNLTINSGVTFNGASFTHTVGGNWINNGTFAPATSTVTFNGALNTTTTGTTTFNTLVVSKSTVGTTLTLNNNITVANLTMTNGRMLTGSNSVTITANRTGNAAILGTITHTHAFAANTYYAFESSFNTINFTTITGSVTSVTVTVTSAPVGDFPSGVSVNRTYDISVTNTGTYKASLRLRYDNAELNSNVETNLTMWQFTSGAWIGMGRASNDVTSNWVQRFNLADIEGRWTFFDGATTHIWKGGTSINWTTASNWKAGTVPLPTDNVQIGAETFTNQPTITTAVTTRSMTFGSTKAVALTIGGTTGSLNVTGSLTGDWQGDQTHTVNVGTRSISVDGDVTLSNGSPARSMQLSASTGTISIGGSLTQSGAGSIVFSGNGSLSIGKDYNYTAGTFTPGTGTVTYNGAEDQVVAGLAYNNLVISKASGTASLSNASTVNGNLTLSGATTVNVNGPLDVTGNVSVNTGVTVNSNAPTLRVGSNLTVDGTLNGNNSAVVIDPSGTAQISGSGTLNFYDLQLDGTAQSTTSFSVQRNLINNGTFQPGTGTVSFTGSTAGVIGGSTPTTSFNNVTINKPSSTLSLNANINTVRTLTITGGTLDMQNFSVTENTGNGALSMAAGTTLRIGSTNTLPTFTLGYSLNATSTVEYFGSTQAIAPVVYGNLTLSNPGNKSFSASGTTEVSNLTTSSPAVLPASATLRVNGNWSNNGVFTVATNSTVVFKGSATQTVGGSSLTDFGNVTVTNTSSPGVSFESNQNLRGVMTLAANVTVDADGSANTSILTLISSGDNPTVDASIATLPNGAAVQGNVTVQRYMTIEGPGGNLYRYISSPVKNATVADMQNEIPVTGNFTGSSVCSGCGAIPSMFLYDEAVAGGGIDGGFEGFPASTNLEVFEAGRGYKMLVRGSILSTARWDLRGPINSGLITVPVTFTNSGTLNNDGWNLVGNPFPSTIDWSSATGWTKTNINAAMYTRDEALEQYAAWNGVIGTNGNEGYIAAGQAFWVKAGLGFPALSLNENTKVAGTQTTFFREAAPDNAMRITLSKGGINDEAVIHFRPEATDNFDKDADALKLFNGGFNLSTQLPGKDKLAINSLSGTFCAATVNLVLDNLPQGSYTLSFDDLDSFVVPTTVTLTDVFASTTTDVIANSTYPFTVTSDGASTGASRFTLSFFRAATPTDFSASAPDACDGGDAIVELTNTSEFVTYEVSVNDEIVFSEPGDTGNTDVTVPAGVLTPGSNSVTVIARPFKICGSPTEKSTTLEIEHVNAPQSSATVIICREGKTTLIATGALAGQHYAWYASQGDDAPVSTEANYVTPTLTESKTYYVAIVAASGCESERTPSTATVVEFNDPVIVLSNDMLTVDYPGTKQWYFNGEILVNETSSSIKPKQTGTYSIKIPVQSCTAEASFEYTVTGLESESVSVNSVYPNPVGGYLYFRHTTSPVIDVVVTSMSGQAVGAFVLTRQGGTTTGQFDMSQMAAGLYLVEIQTSTGVQRIKVARK